MIFEIVRQLVFRICVTTDARNGRRPINAEVTEMTTAANLLALMGMALIRFGGRSAGGFVFMLFGLMVVGLVVWALTRPAGNDASRGNGPTD